jgi:hypothetical protein
LEPQKPLEQSKPAIVLVVVPVIEDTWRTDYEDDDEDEEERTARES